MKKNVLLDFDGVILDMLSSLEKILDNMGYRFIKENVATYNFNGEIGVPKEVVYKWLNSEECFLGETFYPRARQAIEDLKQVANIHAYTMVPDNEVILQFRNNMIGELGLRGKCYTVPKDVPKSLDVDAVFEDCIETLELFVPYTDVKKYIINQTYNQKSSKPYSGLWGWEIRADDFYDAVQKYINAA